MLYLIFRRINGFAGVRTDSQWSTKKFVLHVRLGCSSMSITTPVSHLANEFDVRSELHGHVSFAAVNPILCRS